MNSFIAWTKYNTTSPAPFHRMNADHFVLVFADDIDDAGELLDANLGDTWHGLGELERYTQEHLTHAFPAGIFASISEELTLIWNTQQEKETN